MHVGFRPLCVLWKPRVKQAQSCVQKMSPFSCSVPHQRLNVTFFLWASLTRALRSTSEDMAWMIQVLHFSVWSREGFCVIAASQPKHPGVFPSQVSSAECPTYTRRGLAGSVLIGGGRSECTGHTPMRNGCSLGSGFWRLVTWQHSPGCSTDAVEKDGICSVFARPSFDSSAYHTTSR